MPRIWRGIAIAALAVWSAGGQTVAFAALEAARAKALLESPRWADKAWGAWLAAHLEDGGLHGMLIEQLQQAPALGGAPGNSEERGYLQALLDALIESRMKVSAEAILPLVDCCRAEALILLARDPGNHEEALLELKARELGDGEWLTVNNMLYRLRSGRFFAQTLLEMRVTHEFRVTDGDGGFGSGSGGGVAGDGIVSMPHGFPATGFYQLTASAEEGSVVACPGPHASYYRRVVVPTDKQAGWGSSGNHDRQPYRIEYLAGLVDNSVSAVGPLFERISSIRWSDAPGMAGEAQKAMESQGAGIREFAVQARSAGMASVAGTRVEILPIVRDARGASQDPLPNIGPMEIVLP